MRKRNIFTLALLLMLLPSLVSAKEPGIRGIAFVRAAEAPLRENDNWNAQAVEKIPKGDVVLVLESGKNGFLKVRHNDAEGYLAAGQLTELSRENIELGYGKAKIQGASLLCAPEEAAEVLSSLQKGDRCYTVGINDGYYKVLFGDNLGYIHSSQLDLTEIPYENGASKKSPLFFVQGQSTGLPVSAAALRGEKPKKADGTPVTGADILEEAEKHLGIRYIHGGETPKGFDCSGFTYYVFNCLGYTLPRSVEAQSRCGAAVEGDLEPGDLVFFATNGGKAPSHVGIYAGNGQFLHAPNSRSTVSYGDLTKGYWKEKYIGARRL